FRGCWRVRPRRVLAVHDGGGRTSPAAPAQPPAAAAALARTFNCRRRWSRGWRCRRRARLRRAPFDQDRRRRRGGALLTFLVRLVHDDALERTRAPLVELDPAGQRLDARRAARRSLNST